MSTKSQNPNCCMVRTIYNNGSKVQLWNIFCSNNFKLYHTLSFFFRNASFCFQPMIFELTFLCILRAFHVLLWNISVFGKAFLFCVKLTHSIMIIFGYRVSKQFKQFDQETNNWLVAIVFKRYVMSQFLFKRYISIQYSYTKLESSCKAR